MTILLLDTQVIVWQLTDSPRLGRRVRARLASAAHGDLSISVASWFELAALQGHRDVRFHEPASAIRARLLRDGVLEHDITGDVAIDAAGLGPPLRDPIDKLIVATARKHGLTLLTADAGVLDWPGHLERMDARG